MPNYVPAAVEDGVEPREEPLELLDGERARLGGLFSSISTITSSSQDGVFMVQ